MNPPRVVVAMSGGVDSAVAAGLLARQGYEVIGITMRLWTRDDPQAPRHRRRCCSVEDTDDARDAAQALGIPHYVLNLERQFQESVVDYFCREYERGRTPNPCLACNDRVKFRELLARALALDAEFLATGHYARIDSPDANRYRLLRAADDGKDQSYVLFTLDQAQLSRLLLPIGHHRKEEVRRLAADMGLPVADKPDSADICFIPDNDYRSFIAEHLDRSEGVVDGADGRVVGRHQGVADFTVGQRRALGVALGEKRFVTGIDPGRSLVTIGPEADLLSDQLWAEDVSWVSGEPPPPGAAVEAKIRYRTPAAPAEVHPDGRSVRVLFAQAQRAVTPGQAVVFYRGEEVLGGGIIARSARSGRIQGNGEGADPGDRFANGGLGSTTDPAD
jgi:tRNA-specific 2-thiouridylase